MKRLVPLFILLCVVACTSDHENGGAPQSEPAGQTGDGIDRGTVIVKFKEDPGQVSLTRTRSGETTTGIEAIDPIMTRSGAYEMTRTFPYVEKLEKATRSMGMHLWYTISFDESYPVTRAISELGELEIFDHIEPSYQIQRVDNSPMIELSPKEAASLIGTRQGDDATAMPFDDEYLPMQWHYNNDGKTATNSRAGADIRVFGAWTYTDDSGADGYVGDPSVIVAVNDGGVDYTHPDLAGNMWTNENSGQDDDQWNGDLHGWNFANNTSRINFDNHGTHVAGTVAAVNNNGIGVSGVAGGDFKKGRVGARIITCQIFGTRGDASESRLADAFRYAAYRGAVISQNSWGYRGSSVTPNVILDGIDFFITFAGTNFDPDNLQQAEGSPMKGGIVFFSAGNNNTAREQAPANYAKVHAVTAFGPDYQKAYYSNMGAWVDITAPGGDGVITSNPITDRMVLSTTPGGNYGWNMGTSMSTPHVSGVAALVLSKMYSNDGIIGITPEMLWNQIGSTATTFDIDRYLPDSFDRSLGRAVDASKAVGIEDAPIAPELAYSFENIVSENSITTDRIQLRLNNYFTDESENETLTYSVTATPQGVVNFQPPVNGILTLYGNQVGQATVTITATDKTNLSVSGSFEFIYRDANKPFDLYPLPVKNDILWIRAGLAYQGNVKITMTDSMGKQFYHNDNVVLNILNPTQLNLSKLAPGTYTIEIETKPANTGEGKPVAPKRAKEIFVKL